MGRGPLGGRKKENFQNFAVEGAADADAVEDTVLPPRPHRRAVRRRQPP